MSRVVLRSTKTGKVLWEHECTGAPLIDYVPAQAFRMQDAGEVTIKVTTPAAAHAATHPNSKEK